MRGGDRLEAGPVARRIAAELAGDRDFDRWREGVLDRRAYAQRLDAILALPETVALNENKRALSARIHWRPGEIVREALEAAVARGMLANADYDLDAYSSFAERMHEEWDHGGRSTFIFPEEAQLLFAVANVLRPRRVVVLGSYYGYWAAWALAGAGASLEEGLLLDVDAESNALASANLERVGLADRARAVTEDAVAYMERIGARADLMVLDAEGPETAPDPRLAGKAIYGPIAAAALPRLREGGVLATHNVLLDDGLVRHPYFEALAANNARTLDEFLSIARSTCREELCVATTEGVSLHRR